MPNESPCDQVRLLAWEILWEIEREESFADLILEKVLSEQQKLSSRDRAFITEIVLGTLRWQGKLDRVIRQAARYPEKKIKPKLKQLLRLAAYQILFLDKVPDSAAVNESVRLARAVFGDGKIANFVNAILRAIARQKDQEVIPSFEDDPVEHISLNFSHPRWLVELWIKEFGVEWTRDICAANNIHPPFTIRVNTLRTTRESLEANFHNMGIECRATPFSPWGLILKKSPFLPDDQLWRRGEYYIQDEASQIISLLLEAQIGERILDACAAPGGKTTHLAELMKNQGQIVALDISLPKLKLLQENCRRLGVSIVKAICTDAAQIFPFSSPALFDRIIIDPPCTGLGILHRHPEIKWRREPADISRLALLQQSLLENISSWLKPGGILVYSTCTMTRAENDLVIDTFLARHKEFVLEDLRAIVPPPLRLMVDKRGFLRTYPELIIPQGDYRLDGFFAARMKKNEK